MHDETAPDYPGRLVPAIPTPTAVVAVSARTGGKSLDEAIAEWLEEKAAHTGSGRTLAAYSETLTRFRARLHTLGADLDTPDEQIIVDAAKALARERSALGRNANKPVAPGTFNQRIAILSSFYEYGRRNRIVGLIRSNPLEVIKRQKDEEYAKATPLDPREVVRRLGAIDRETLQGIRDYALLSIGLSTGRRMTELATMTWASVQIAGGVVTLTFPKAKGAKVMRDELSKPVGEALMTWVYRWYGGVNIPADTPIWIALEANSRGHRLSRQAIAAICEKRLGTSKVHAMRHTFAHGMDAVGASVSEIQARLGHSNLATTGRYLAKLRSAKNSHADELAALFGLK
jgi:integrase/recombinase XerC